MEFTLLAIFAIIFGIIVAPFMTIGIVFVMFGWNFFGIVFIFIGLLNMLNKWMNID